MHITVPNAINMSQQAHTHSTRLICETQHHRQQLQNYTDTQLNTCQCPIQSNTILKLSVSVALQSEGNCTELAVTILHYTATTQSTLSTASALALAGQSKREDRSRLIAATNNPNYQLLSSSSSNSLCEQANCNSTAVNWHDISKSM